MGNGVLEVGLGTGAIAVAESPSRHQALLTRWAVRKSYRRGRFAVRGGQRIAGDPPSSVGMRYGVIESPDEILPRMLRHWHFALPNCFLAVLAQRRQNAV